MSFPLIGHWLVREDIVHEADAIVVLSGNLPTRSLEAAKLYRNGYAKEIWLTHPNEKQVSLKDPSIHGPSEDVFNFNVLRHEGVPAETIHVLKTPIVNTADELDVISAALKSREDDSVIIVTNKPHTRRVYSLWNKYHSDEGQVIVHGVTNDPFSPSTWWKTATGKAQVIHELLGMINVWAGMPVHSASQVHESFEWLASNWTHAFRGLTPTVMRRPNFYSGD
ncbi:MAG TPA: YdcF family protein [Bacteroidota bacterium]|nr:YdcF family protein [Bacteroidota bacterium]